MKMVHIWADVHEDLKRVKREAMVRWHGEETVFFDPALFDGKIPKDKADELVGAIVVRSLRIRRTYENADIPVLFLERASDVRLDFDATRSRATLDATEKPRTERPSQESAKREGVTVLSLKINFDKLRKQAGDIASDLVDDVAKAVRACDDVDLVRMIGEVERNSTCRVTVLRAVDARLVQLPQRTHELTTDG